MINKTSRKQKRLKTLTGIAAVLAMVLCGAGQGRAEEAATTLGTAVNQVAQSETSHPDIKKEHFQKFLEKHPKLKERLDADGNGQIDRKELKQARKFRKIHPRHRYQENTNYDYDNNPPGPVGGNGTNWENVPGPQGGTGASPNYKSRHYQKDPDNNPPGIAGGKGTNWENRPGPQGGPGASPDKYAGRRQAR